MPSLDKSVPDPQISRSWRKRKGVTNPDDTVLGPTYTNRQLTSPITSGPATSLILV